MTPRIVTPDKHGTLVLYGYGLQIHVRNGHLDLEGGLGEDRVFARCHKVTSKLKRLVLLAHDGYLTLDALFWLHDAKAQLLVFDRDGELRFADCTDAHREDAHLRRLQAMHGATDVGLDIARTLLGRKMLGQAENLTGSEPHV
ncbi:MAG TPA: hypothetical protein VKU60_14955, partial [Chloroflexota bacterium]|nr:hypothetical protein [Chloroflexota bacterium]